MTKLENNLVANFIAAARNSILGIWTFVISIKRSAVAVLQRYLQI